MKWTSARPDAEPSCAGAPGQGRGESVTRDRAPASRRQPFRWLRTARSAGGIVAIVGLTLLTAACSTGGRSSGGSGGSSRAGGPANSRSTVGFASCMRTHGVPAYPDPDANGTLQKTSAQRLGVSSSRYQTATQACQHLLPSTGVSLTASSLQQCYLSDVCPQALVQQAMSAGLTFSRCMRGHGVPNWPDPTVDSEGRPLFNINVPRPTPPHINAAMTECSRLAHPGSLLAWG